VRRVKDPAATRKRIRAWICSYSEGIDPEEHADAVMRLLTRKGFEDYQWTKGWATRRKRKKKWVA
jgi:hypothetical protein